jgi:hypothetical protein
MVLENHPRVVDYIDRLRNANASETVPEYMRVQVARERRVLKGVSPPARSKLQELSRSQRWYLRVRYFVKSCLYPLSEKARALRRFSSVYESLASPVPRKPYVLVALHYQPERTTNPEGGVFDDQLLLIRLLAANVPPEWTVCVKEHSSQFRHVLSGQHHRSVEFYKGIAELSNVQLLPLTVLGAEVMMGAQAVATVTGTIGFEAVLKRKPVLIFGAAWYAGCPNVYSVGNSVELTKALTEIRLKEVSGGDWDREVDAFLAELVSQCYSGFIHHSGRSLSGVSDADLVENLFLAVGDALKGTGFIEDMSSLSPTLTLKDGK